MPLHRDVCFLLSEILKAERRLTPKDKAIVEAILRHGNPSAAARELAPGRPSYRSYIHRRLNHFRDVLRTLVLKTALGGLLKRVGRVLNDKNTVSK